MNLAIMAARHQLASLNLDEIRRLGPEPLDPRFTFSDFARLFEGRTGRIKALLMNPTFIAGIGNHSCPKQV